MCDVHIETLVSLKSSQVGYLSFGSFSIYKLLKAWRFSFSTTVPLILVHVPRHCRSGMNFSNQQKKKKMGPTEGGKFDFYVSMC